MVTAEERHERRKAQNRENTRRRTAERRAAGLCVKCGTPPERAGNRLCAACTKKNNKYTTGIVRNMRAKVIEGYGGKCTCCGESNKGFLSLDHVNNDGHIQRKQQGRNSNYAYWEAKREGFPDKYQVLCFNCNMGRAKNGGICPHKLLDNEAEVG